MTSGSLVYDRSTAWTDPGQSWYGTKFTKSWSGADAPKPSRVPRIPVVLRRYSRKRGFYDVTVYIRDPNAPGGGFGKSRGEHAYNKDIVEYNSTLVTFKPTGWTETRTVATFGYCFFGSFSDYSTLLSSATLAAQSELRSALQAGNGSGGFNAGTFLGEMGESVGMIGDAATTVASTISNLRKGNWLGAVQGLFAHTGRRPRKEDLLPRKPSWVAQNAASCWLELQYGWLPLLADVRSAATAFAAWANEPKRLKARFGRTLREEDMRTYDFGDLGQPRGGATKEVSVHYKVVLKHAPGLSYTLGLQDPLTIAWELVPLSFVADWFVPIGEYLEAVGAANGIEIESVTKSVKANIVIRIPFTKDSSYFHFDRSISSAWPSAPLPKFKGLGGLASFSHCASGIALVVQSVK